MKPYPTSEEDKLLLDGCLNGDGKCRENFVRQYSSLVYATVLRVTKSKNTILSEQCVEDLHQTVFLTMFDKNCRKLRQFKGKNGCRLASWVRLVAGNVVLDYLRRGTDALAHKQQTMPLELASELNDPEPLAIDQLAAAEQWRQVEEGLGQLKKRDQLLIRLHCLEGLSLPVVAKTLGLSEKNIHSVKHRAVQRLKDSIIGKKKR